MDPSPSSAAWGGAAWIGGGPDDLVLYSPYLAIFDVKYVIAIAQGSTRAGFVYGANDSRLMTSTRTSTRSRAARTELHQAGTRRLGLGSAPDGKAKLHVYRAGYKDTDTPAQPLKTFEIDGR